MAHKLRKKFHADVQDKWIRELDDKSAVCILDYKMKFLGLTFREAQGEMIGQAGTSIHILYFLVKKPDDFSVSAARDGDGLAVVVIADKDFLVVPHRVLCDDNKQNYFHTLAGLEMSLSNLKREFPHLERVSLLSDGAANYDCTATMIGMHEVGTRAGIHIAEHVIFEAGEGKSVADSDGNCVGVTLRAYVNEGNDLHGAADLKQGLDHGAREGSGVPAVNMEMVLDRQKEAQGETVGKKAKSAVKTLLGISAISHRVYEKNGVRLREHFEIGEGDFKTYEVLKEQHPGLSELFPAGAAYITQGNEGGGVAGGVNRPEYKVRYSAHFILMYDGIVLILYAQQCYLRGPNAAVLRVPIGLLYV
jgi:hypothetical protein